MVLAALIIVGIVLITTEVCSTVVKIHRMDIEHKEKSMKSQRGSADPFAVVGLFLIVAIVVLVAGGVVFGVQTPGRRREDRPGREDVARGHLL